jgi:hypothetical protein
MHRVLDRYAAPLADGLTVVMGDFNSNAAWDEDVRREIGN